MLSHPSGVVSAGTGGTTRGRRAGSERGFTLSEVLVAIAVFAVISAIAMTLYSRLQNSFKQGENAATQQQNTRIAFDRMIADLRMAGFNYNPDGDTGRPDEQIEGMWQNAVTIRGDFDFETSDATTPESTLGGPGDPYEVVSTGNDEIVTYALRKPNGSGGTTIQFQADVSQVPRDGSLETVPLDNVYLDMNSPPYTLYRITLKPGGTPLSSIADYQPVADNIKSLQFIYYDGTGSVLSTFAGGMDDPNSVALRKKIAKVQVRVIGMTQDPDLAYLDPGDSNPASNHYRKYELSGDVTPRNLGFVGMPDLDLTDPNTPSGLNVCPGHCQGLWTSWTANDPAEGVVKYAVSYGPSQIAQGTPQDVYSTGVYLNGLTTSSSYVVGVAAVDSGGNQSSRAFSTPTTVADATTPGGPVSLALTSMGGGDALANMITVTWGRPSINDPNTALGCDVVSPSDSNTPLRDLRGYRLYRGANASFDPNVPAQVQRSWDPNTLLGSDADPNMDDTSVVNCRTYYYQAVTEDLCGNRSIVALGSGSASTTDLPGVPISVTATDMGLNRAKIDWSPVTQDVNGAGIFIDTYKVWRAEVPTGNDPNLATYSLVYDGTVSNPGLPSFTDANYPNPPPGSDLYYAVSARDDCLPVNESAPSLPALLTSCNFGGSIAVSMNPGGSPLTGTQVITATVSGGAVPVSGAVTIRNSTTMATVVNQTSTAYPYTWSWNTGVSPTTAGSYDILVAVTNNAGCTAVATQNVSVAGNIPCCIAATTPNITNNTTLGTVSGGATNNEVGFQIINNCGTDVMITRLRMEWSDLACPKPSVPQLAGFSFDVGDPSDTYVLVPAVNTISGSNPRADFDLRNSPFVPFLLQNGDTSDLSYIFTKAMAFKCNGNPVGNTIASQFDFRAGSFSGGSCRLDVVADPASAPSLCDPVIDPNCPGF